MIFLARTLFAAVILFELLNGLGILHVPLDFSWFGLIITAGIAWGAVEILFGRAGQVGLLRIALPISLAGIVLDVAGDVLHLYARIAWYDRALHVIGGAVVAYLVYLLVKERIGMLGGTLRWLLIVGSASLLGSLYEIEEWLEDAWLHKKALRLGDGPDTADDLLMNIVGAAVVAVLCIAYETRKKKHEK